MRASSCILTVWNSASLFCARSLSRFNPKSWNLYEDSGNSSLENEREECFQGVLSKLWFINHCVDATRLYLHAKKFTWVATFWVTKVCISHKKKPGCTQKVICRGLLFHVLVDPTWTLSATFLSAPTILYNILKTQTLLCSDSPVIKVIRFQLSHVPLKRLDVSF